MKARRKMKQAMEPKNKLRKSNRMLLDELPLVFQPSFAKAVGVYGAIALQQLHFHLANPENGRPLNGKRWIYKTYENWQKDDFPFWSTDQIQRIFWALEKRGLIASCQPEGRESRRKYYRIDYHKLDEAIASASRTHAQEHAKSRHRSREIASSSLSETTRTEKSSTHRAARNDVCFESDLSLYSEKAFEVIEAYHNIVCDTNPHWQRVNKFSENLERVIEFREAQCVDLDFIGLFNAVVNGYGEISLPKQRRLISLLRDNT
jgi:hypothetical protein